MPASDLIALIFHIWLVKTFIEILGLPISIHVARKLKKIEQLDIYDTDTRFTLFSLNTCYAETDNKYHQ